MDFIPLRDRIVIERDKIKEEILESGVILTEEVQEKPQTGTVLTIGSEVKDIKIGDKVIFGKNDGVEQKIEEKTVLIMKENMIWGVIN